MAGISLCLDTVRHREEHFHRRHRHRVCPLPELFLSPVGKPLLAKAGELRRSCSHIQLNGTANRRGRHDRAAFRDQRARGPAGWGGTNSFHRVEAAGAGRPHHPRARPGKGLV